MRRKKPRAGGSYNPEPRRSYIESATKAATHPVRSSILKALKEGAKSTVELEQITGEARYNLYHHLNLLEDVGLVNWEKKDGKMKLYSLNTPNRPTVAVLVFDEHEIKTNSQAFEAMISSISALEGKEIPNAKKINKAEIYLYYDWGDDDSQEDDLPF